MVDVGYGRLEEVDQGYFNPRLLLCLGLWKDLCSFAAGVSNKGWTRAIRRGALLQDSRV